MYQVQISRESCENKLDGGGHLPAAAPLNCYRVHTGHILGMLEASD